MRHTTEHFDRLHQLLTHALMGDRVAFDAAVVFGLVAPDAAALLWTAGRALALTEMPMP